MEGARPRCPPPFAQDPGNATARYEAGHKCTQRAHLLSGSLRKSCRNPPGGVKWDQRRKTRLHSLHHLPRRSIPSVAVLSSTISSYSSAALDIFCASRGFMLRPPITIPTHKRQLHPHLLSTVCIPFINSPSALPLTSDRSAEKHPIWLLLALLTFVVMSTTSSTATGEFPCVPSAQGPLPIRHAACPS